jgi:hypothetical protein
MGLDIIEFVMAVEEAFDITIPDDEAELATTPGKLADLVMKKVGTTQRSTCLSSRAFYLLRRCTTNELNIPRKMVRPDTPLDEIIPQQNRKNSWEKLKKVVGASAWPDLRRSEGTVTLLVLLVICLSATAAFFANWIWQSPILIPVTAMVVAILAAWMAVIATRPLKTAFPPGYMNLGDLARFMVARNPTLLESAAPAWTRERVWCVLRALILEHLDVTDFTEDSRFVQDMHIDE